MDLDRHAIVEASAGTGKTFALERLVLRLLSEKGARLDEILLVTFTEKATGELKGRLRARLESAVDAAPWLRPALDSFDQANVHTIHAFCQRALQEYAFENRAPLRSDVVDDAVLLKTCLLEVQRKDWHERYGDRLSTVLELAGFGGDRRWEQLVLGLTKHWRLACGHGLCPAPSADWPGVLDRLDAGLRELHQELRRLAGPIDERAVEKHVWHSGYAALARASDGKVTKVIRPLLRWIAADPIDLVPTFRRLLTGYPTSKEYQRYGYSILINSLAERKQVELHRCCPRLPEAIDLLERARQSVDWNALEYQLVIHTLGELRARADAYKRERGLLSFDDMIDRLDGALDPERSPHADLLVACLRSRYRYAIVDEFQDTDPVQWRILERLFVKGADGHRLYVVGDPKQAIFGFRGADLQAYLGARRALEEHYGAARYPLDVNWRSSPELLTSLNALFQRSGWFDALQLEYWPARPPPEEDRRCRLAMDESGVPALCALAVDAAPLSAARRAFAQWVASEARRLLDPHPLLEIELADQPRRSLDAGDICVLVRSRGDARPVLESLRAAGVPCSFYKESGIWMSPEARHLGYVLRALAHPEDSRAFRKALLTRFFRVRPTQLASGGELGPTHRARALFQEWLGLAGRRRWGRLFQSLGEETGVFHAALNGLDVERWQATLGHIFQTLEQAAYEQDLDLIGLLDLFRRKAAEGGDDGLHPIETDRGKVKVITMHAAKGLEFPVVFLAGGFTTRPGDLYVKARDPEGRLVFHLGADERIRAEAEREAEAEERRLFYVALTRAMFKLYLPVLDSTERGYRSPGPLVTLLGPAIRKAQLPIQELPAAPRFRSSERNGRAGVALRLAPSGPVLELTQLFPRIDPDLQRRRILTQSFSSLHRRQARRRREEPSYGERPRRNDDDPGGTDPLRGPIFGTLVHDVLEQVDYAAIGAAREPAELVADRTPTRLLIDLQVHRHAPKIVSRLGRSSLEGLCRDETARLIWHALHTPLSEAGGPLWSLPAGDQLREVQFDMPDVPGLLSAEMRWEEKFTTGFIDLIFRRAGRYFLVDWKTNVLDGYSRAEIDRNMDECSYHTQYGLYLRALARWLGRVHPDFEPTRHFGGVYYLYLRGLNGCDETTGTFFHRPTAVDLTDTS